MEFWNFILPWICLECFEIFFLASLISSSFLELNVEPRNFSFLTIFMPQSSVISLRMVGPWSIWDLSFLIPSPNLCSHSIPVITVFAQSSEFVLYIISSANDNRDFFSIAVFRAGIWHRQWWRYKLKSLGPSFVPYNRPLFTANLVPSSR